MNNQLAGGETQNNYLLTLGMESLSEWVQLARDARNQQCELIYFGSSQDVAVIRESGAFSDFGRVYELLSFSTDDILRTVEEFSSGGYDGRCITARDMLISTYDESLMMACAEVRQRFGIAGELPGEVIAYIDKSEMRRRVPSEYLVAGVVFSGELYCNNPDQYYGSLLESINLPLIAKPTCMTGSKEISRIDSVEALRKWCDANRTRSDMILEEFIEGTQYHVDSAHRNGEEIFVSVARYHTPCLEYVSHNRIRGSLLLDDTDEVYRRLIAANQNIIASLGPVPDGYKHLEMFVAHDGQLKFVEIAARPGGGGIPDMLQKGIGVYIPTEHLRIKFGLAAKPAARQRHVAWITVPPRPGVVTRLCPPSVTSEIEIRWNVKPGDRTERVTSLTKGVANVVVWSDDRPQLLADLQILLSHSYFEMNSVE